MMQYTVDADNMGGDSWARTFEQPPMLDAQTAHHLVAFLQWTQNALQIVHNINLYSSPFWFNDARDSADSAMSHAVVSGLRFLHCPRFPARLYPRCESYRTAYWHATRIDA